MPGPERTIEFHQVLKTDGTVHSHQWIILPASCTPDLSVTDIVDRYLSFIRSCTVGFVRPARNADGITLRFLGLPLIRLSPPAVCFDETSSHADLFINGGLLVQRESCSKGKLRFSVIKSTGQIRIEIRLSDYCPLLLGSQKPNFLQKWLYRLTQASIHKLLTIRFLTNLCQELTGGNASCRIVKRTIADAEEI